MKNALTKQGKPLCWLLGTSVLKNDELFERMCQGASTGQLFFALQQMDDRFHFSLHPPLVVPLLGINIQWSHFWIGWLQTYPLTLLIKTFDCCGTKITPYSMEMRRDYYITISNLLSRFNNNVVTIEDIIFDHGIAFDWQHKSFPWVQRLPVVDNSIGALRMHFGWFLYIRFYRQGTSSKRSLAPVSAFIFT
jgi:hypothetical protein